MSQKVETSRCPRMNSFESLWIQGFERVAMGQLYQMTLERIFGDSGKQDIAIVGLDNAGKTTILYQMKHGQAVSTIPTIGFNVETFKVKNTKFNSWDIGGQDEIRVLWEPYIDNAAGIVFVVDILDEARWGLAAEELNKIYKKETNINKPVLILANKADNPDDPENYRRQEEIERVLQIEGSGIVYQIFPVAALRSEYNPEPEKRLFPAFEWLIKALNEKPKMRGYA